MRRRNCWPAHRSGGRADGRDTSELAQPALHPADLLLIEGHQPAHVALIGDDTIGQGRIETRSTSIEETETWLAQLAALDRTALPGAA